MDFPNQRKKHSAPTPLVGGLVIYLLLLSFYYENFDLACEQMSEDPHKMIKLNFTKPSEEYKGCFNAGIGAKSMTASIRANGGWFKHYGFNGLNCWLFTSST